MNRTKITAFLFAALTVVGISSVSSPAQASAGRGDYTLANVCSEPGTTGRVISVTRTDGSRAELSCSDNFRTHVHAIRVGSHPVKSQAVGGPLRCNESIGKLVVLTGATRAWTVASCH